MRVCVGAGEGREMYTSARWAITVAPPPPLPIHNRDLRVERELGSGQFGRVLHVAWRSAEHGEQDLEEHFALKIIDRKRFKHPKHEEMVLAEKQTMERLDDPFHTKLINT